MRHILIIEDDIALCQGICLALKSAEQSVTACTSLQEARIVLRQTSPDLVILDINLPDGNGLDFLKEYRKSCDGAVIILTANDMETDIVAGLELGADDYITKPFSLAVLRARVNAQLRRTSSAGKVWKIADYIFDFSAMAFFKGNQAVELSKTEQKLLRLLVENRGSTLSRSDLVDRIWTDGAEYVDENALSVTIKRLRDKLNAHNYIKTVYGIGYTWVMS